MISSVAELQDLVDHLHELEVDQALMQQLIAQTDAIVRGLPELLKALLERQRRLHEDGTDVDAACTTRCAGC